MRAAPKPSFIFSTEVNPDNEKEYLIGLHFSADMAAEHEFGISSLRKRLALPTAEDVLGIDKRRIHNPDALSWVDRTDGSSLLLCVEPFSLNFYSDPTKSLSELTFRSIYVGPELYKSGKNKGKPKPGIGIYKENNIAAAWDERSFGVRVTGDAISQLKEIYEAAKNKDCAIFIAGNNPFGGNSLVLAIISRIPKERLESMKAADQEAYQLMLDHRASGVEELCKKNKFEYYALSPRRQKDGTLMWFLNPRDQRKYPFGWFTYEKLKELIEA